MSSPSMQARQWLQPAPGAITTSSPTATCVTPSPTWSIVPAASLPRMCGISIL